MALKSEFGEAGFGMWDEWSRGSDNYNERVVRAQWRSFKLDGGVTAGTLIYLAREAGWTGGRGFSRGRPPSASSPASERHTPSKRREAAKRAGIMLEQSHWGKHPYLAAKGFPNAHAPVLGRDSATSLLVIPMHHVSGPLMSVQTIDPHGVKKFLKHSHTKGCINPLGAATPDALAFWFVEGYATGLSVLEALLILGRALDQVVVAFSDSNMVHVAKLMPGKQRYVVADNDYKVHKDGKVTNAGEEAAKKTGLPYWMPPTPKGYDACDYRQTFGTDELADSAGDRPYRIQQFGAV